MPLHRKAKETLCMVEYYPAVKMNGNILCALIRTDFQDILLSEKRKPQVQKEYL